MIPAASFPFPDDFPAMFLATDADGTIFQVSNLWLSTTGYARAEVIGKTQQTFLAEPPVDASHDICPPDMDSGTALAESVCYLSKDGTFLAGNLSTFDIVGKPGLISVFTRREKEATNLFDQLQFHSFRLQSCLEGTNAGTWEWNVQTGETRFNERWAQIVGRTLDELSPISIQTWLDLAHPEDLDSSSAALAAHWRGETEFYEIEARMRHKDGQWVWVQDRGRVFTWTSDGKPEWMFGTHVLIDEQRRKISDAERMQRLLSRTGQVAGVGGWEFDLETNELIWTDETRRIHGVDASYVPNVEEAINFYAPEARAPIAKAVERALENGTPWDLELPFLRKTGERIWVRAVGEVEYLNGKPRRLLGAFQDISERVRANDDLRAAQAWAALATQSGRVGLWSFDVVTGAVTWDEQMAAHFHVPLDNLPRSINEWHELLPDEMGDRIRSSLRRAISKNERIEVEIDFSARDCSTVSLKLTGEAQFDKDGLIGRIQGACFDLTPERRLMTELQEQTSRMSVTLSSIGDGVITTDTDRRITWMNEVASKLTGWTLKDAIGTPSDQVFAVFRDETGAPAQDPIRQALLERRIVNLEPRTSLRRRDGSSIDVDDSAAPIFDTERRAVGAVLVFRDVTEQRQLSREIEYRATHDLLTTLLNRAEFEQQLAACLADRRTKNESFLFFVDLDHFKRVNDSFGHDTGDAVLCQVGQILRDVAGKRAIVGRRGGDEFTLLVQTDDHERARKIGERICAEVARLGLNLAGKSMPGGLGASVGVVDLAAISTSLADCIRCADIAAYAAKNAGGGHVCFWTETDRSMRDVADHISLIETIEKANAEGSWTVYEQAIAPVSGSGQGDDMRELLLRLPVEGGDYVEPDRIIGAAERFGLMPSIDMWMCRYCLTLIEKKRQLGEETIYCVNLSPSSVTSRCFQRDVLDLVATTPPETLSCLCIEITETSMVENFAAASDFLAALRASGIRIAIDDFGSGATSFRYFRELPADFLKLDGNFIREIDDPVAAASIECFITMARAVGLKTVAEHVETEDQLARLEALGVDFIQGYVIDRPKAVA